jgi:formylglycine-generating enzyme required for sulfatase activity
MVYFRRDYDAGLSQLADILGVRVPPPEPARPPGHAPPHGTMPEAEAAPVEEVMSAEAVPVEEEEMPTWLRTLREEGLEEPTLKEAPLPSEPEMILIPAGEFLMGSDPSVDKDARDEEQPQHTLYLPDYYLAKTPMTNAQYAAFVQATYRQPTHWEAGKPPSGEEDHPVVNVSWYDAVAYCHWLSEVTGRPYRLPSEAEWEKGARGTDGRIYPWGNQWDAKRCNTRESGKEGTTPVGVYPEGASPYGLLDMAGNVWEWTRSSWGEDPEEPSFKHPYDPADGREDLEAPDTVLRVLRGGSWFHLPDFARCVLRRRHFPGSSFYHVGFRLVSPVLF